MKAAISKGKLTSQSAAEYCLTVLKSYLLVVLSGTKSYPLNSMAMKRQCIEMDSGETLNCPD